MSAREELAAAANTVDGISVNEYFWQTTDPGTGWIRFSRQDWPNVLGGLDTWQVLIVLSADVAEAEKYLEDNLSQLVDAVGQVLAVRSAEPQEYALPDGGRVPVLNIQGQRESE